jgi:hypothetical protein
MFFQLLAAAGCTRAACQIATCLHMSPSPVRGPSDITMQTAANLSGRKPEVFSDAAFARASALWTLWAPRVPPSKPRRRPQQCPLAFSRTLARDRAPCAWRWTLRSLLARCTDGTALPSSERSAEPTDALCTCGRRLRCTCPTSARPRGTQRRRSSAPCPGENLRFSFRRGAGRLRWLDTGWPAAARAGPARLVLEHRRARRPWRACAARCTRRRLLRGSDPYRVS